MDQGLSHLGHQHRRSPRSPAQEGLKSSIRFGNLAVTLTLWRMLQGSGGNRGTESQQMGVNGRARSKYRKALESLCQGWGIKGACLCLSIFLRRALFDYNVRGWICYGHQCQPTLRCWWLGHLASYFTVFIYLRGRELLLPRCLPLSKPLAKARS